MTDPMTDYSNKKNAKSRDSDCKYQRHVMNKAVKELKNLCQIAVN